MVDIRTIGLAGAIDLAPMPDAPGLRGYRAMEETFHQQDLLVRIAGDSIVLCPPLIVSEDQIGEIVAKAGKAIRAAA